MNLALLFMVKLVIGASLSCFELGSGVSDEHHALPTARYLAFALYGFVLDCP